MEGQNSVLSRRWVYLCLGTLALLFAGIIYGWSILKAPLAEEFGWSSSALSLNFTLTMCFFCLGGMLGGVLLKRFPFRSVCILAACLSMIGFVSAASLEGKIGRLYFSYGFLAGLGIGIAYNSIISTVSAWFPDKKGLCSGVLMMGFGASALVVGSLADRMIANPSFGWRGTYRSLGYALGIILFMTALILKRPETNAVNAKPIEYQKEAASTDSGTKRDFTTSEMLRSLRFWKAFFCIIFLSSVGSTVISMAKDLALSVGTAAATATLLVGLLSVCNGLGRVITGALFDRFGRRKTMVGANITTICAAGITLLAMLSNSKLLCIIGLCLTGLSYGTCPTISSAYISEVFGTKYFSMNFPIMNCNLIFASFIATGASLISSATGGYAGAFILLLALSVVALLLNLSLKD